MGGRTSANLDLFVNDNGSQTQSIKYRTDAAIYDLEAPSHTTFIEYLQIIKKCKHCHRIKSSKLKHFEISFLFYAGTDVIGISLVRYSLPK